jgi:hypothetical protein
MRIPTGTLNLDSKDTLQFLVKGSAFEPYTVWFGRREGGNISAHCNCLAGQKKMACKHRIRILRGSTEDIVSKNKDDVAIVALWVVGSPVETALQKVEQLEKKAARINDDLIVAKQALARQLTS